MAGRMGLAGRLIPRQFVPEMWQTFAGRLGESAAPGAAARLARWHRSVAASLGPASGVTAIHDVAGRTFFKLLGFDLHPIDTPATADQIASIATGRRTGPLPVVVGPWAGRLDGLTRRAVQEAIAREARWAFCFNARAVRLVDADRPHARRWLDVDLAGTALDQELARLVWALLRAEAFDRRAPDRDALIGSIVAAADAHGRRIADSLQLGVREALAVLSRALRRAVRSRRTTDAAIVDQSLTIVYRLLFLLFAEARALVPMWNPIYRDSYSVDGLREACDSRDAAIGLWDALQAISRLAHAGCSTRDLRVTAFNGQLFSPDRAPIVERARIRDDTMTHVLRALTDAPGSAGATRIAYGDLGVEQLGSIYERLLDATPALEASLGRSQAAEPRPEGPARARAARWKAQVASARRKESGTFYTPRTMAEYLVRETLAPLVRQASCEDILELRVLDPAMGSGAFLVAACRFLAEACEAALAREHPTRWADPRRERARLRRLVAQRCLFGVDLNPVAVQLARLSLWLATLAADAPLTFLDHHLCAGDSLVGASVDDLMRGWPSRRRASLDDRTPGLFEADAVTDLMQTAMPLRASLEGPDDSVETVRAKEQALARSLTEGALARWIRLGDLWCARWFADLPDGPPPASAWQSLGDHVLTGTSSLPAHVAAPWLRASADAARAHRFLHWPLRFPEVFFDAAGRRRPDGGFDAIVGNPPWDMVRDDARDPLLRRERSAASAALVRFTRESGLYRSGRVGHLNRYQLFVERALGLARPGARLGLVVPWGLAGDVASAPLRQALLDRCETEAIVAFDNAEGVFPVHRGVRFLLVSATTGRPTTRIACRFGERSLVALERTDPRGGPRGREAGSPAAVALTPQWLRRVSGEGLELPYVRSAHDVVLLDRLHARWPALGSEDGWGAAFGRELNASDDRGLFVSSAGRGGIPVVDGKHVVPFGAHVERAERWVPPGLVRALERRVPSIRRARLAYRDVASSTNRTTLIAALLPAGVVSTHTLFCLRSPLDPGAQHVLCALMNSLVANYLIRLRVTTHVTVALVSRLPVPRPARGSAAFESLAAHARALGSVALAAPGRSRHREAGAWETSPHWAGLQALAAQLYGLDREEFEYVLSTFPLIDAAARRAALGALGG